MSLMRPTAANPTRDRIVEVVLEHYQKTKRHHPVTGGAEVFWDTQFRLCVLLLDADEKLLAFYRLTRDRGIHRVPMKKPRPDQMHPFTLDNRIILEQVNRMAAGLPLEPAT